MKRNYMLMAIAAAAAAAGALFFSFRKSDGTSTDETSNNVRKTETKRIPAKSTVRKDPVAPADVRPKRQTSRSGGAAKTERKKPVRGMVRNSVRYNNATDEYTDDNGKPYPKSDQALFARADRAIENDDVEEARKLAGEALQSPNSDLRAKALEAAAWFGKDAMSEITPYLSDPNPEIAETAHDEWLNALQNIENDAEKAGVIEMALKALRDKEMLEDVSNELIGIDELAAVQAVVNVIQSGNTAAAPHAREAYEFITGDEWTGVDAAEQWLQENYTPPEPD